MPHSSHQHSPENIAASTIRYPADKRLQALLTMLFPVTGNIADNHNHNNSHTDTAQRIGLYLQQHRSHRYLFKCLLFLLDKQAYLRFARPLTRLNPTQQQRWLQQVQRKKYRGLLLKALAMPLKFFYLQNPYLHKTLGSRIQLAAVKAEKFRWQQQITTLTDCNLDNNTEVDAIIIGTGAGGAVAAAELASRGLAVVLVEEGSYYDRSHFNGNIPELVKKLYRKTGLTAAFGNALIPIPLGRNVGGTTTINSGTCLRVDHALIQHWQQQQLCDFNSDELALWYEQIEAELQVQPATPAAVGPIARIIARGTAALNITGAHPLQRNASGCDGQGLCQFGCPTDAKRSANVSYVPKALSAGALLITDSKAIALLRDKYNRVCGVRLQCSQSSATLQLKARATIVAMGSLLTPAFLQKNNVRNHWLGKNLSLHPCGLVSAQFPDNNLQNSRTIPQGFGVAQFKAQGLMLEGATPPLLAYGLLQKELGLAYSERINRYQQTAFFGFMIKDQSRGRVFRYQPGGFPLVYYHMNNADFKQFIFGIKTLCHIYLAAGASQVEIAGSKRLPDIKCAEDIARLDQIALKPRDFLISAYHPLGTARMSLHAQQGVVGSNLEVHNEPGLYVMDGSVLPSSLGANPQLTIMAVCARAAAQLAQKLASQSEY